jgi:hypothetical protein
VGVDVKYDGSVGDVDIDGKKAGNMTPPLGRPKASVEGEAGFQLTISDAGSVQDVAYTTSLKAKGSFGGGDVEIAAGTSIGTESGLQTKLDAGANYSKLPVGSGSIQWW